MPKGPTGSAPKPVHVPSVTRSEALRRIRDKSDELTASGRKLAPTNGAIPVGGAHIDGQAAGDALATFLTSIRSGKSPAEAAIDASAEHALWMTKWNASRLGEYQVHRPTDGQNTWIDWAERLVSQSAPDPVTEVTPAVVETPPARVFWQTTDGERARMILGDVVAGLRLLPDKSVQCCITSPPYWGLRDYGTGTWTGGDKGCDHLRPNADNHHTGLDKYEVEVRGREGKDNGPKNGNQSLKSYGNSCGKCGAVREDSQLGSEKLHDCLGWARGENCADREWVTGCFVCRLRVVFREVKRVLRDDGSIWINLGDSYAGGGGGNYGTGISSKQGNGDVHTSGATRGSGLPSGNLCGVPWRVALALQADGWILRSDIPWVKRSSMPESVTNRPAKSLEYVFLFVKKMGYYYDHDAVRRPSSESSGWAKQRARGEDTWKYNDTDERIAATGQTIEASTFGTAGSRNFRNADLWFESVDEPHGMTGVGDEVVGLDVTSSSYEGAHFATFGTKLITPMIKAGSSEYGACSDCGAAWERVVERTPMVTAETPKGALKRETDPDQFRTALNATMVEAQTSKTIGWRPSCECGTDDVRPCVILDPFLGSGTTLSVSLELGRSGVGIELSEKYLTNNAIPRIVGSLMKIPELSGLIPRKGGLLNGLRRRT